MSNTIMGVHLITTSPEKELHTLMEGDVKRLFRLRYNVEPDTEPRWVFEAGGWTETDEETGETYTTPDRWLVYVEGERA